jgi:uncharacterized OB-fold protein
MNQHKSDVRSKLARSENRGEIVVAQCEKTYTVPARSIFGRFAGQTIRCDRPASGHRVHQHDYIQF